LKEHGYTTAIVGKWHLKSEPRGFDYWNILPGQGDYYNPRFTKMGRDTTYSGYVTDLTTDLALEWITNARKEQKPFFLMLHQKAPHRNQMPPLENLELFNDRQFPLPSNFFDTYKDRTALQRQKTSMLEDLEIDFDNKASCDTCLNKGPKWNPRAYKRDVGRLAPEQRLAWDKAYQKEYEEFSRIKTREELVRWQFQRYMEDYLRCVKSVDDNVGKLLNYLDEQGLAENTIVVYTSDQGAFLGEHGLYDKRFMYNESFRTPMMIRYPRLIKPRQDISRYVLNLDVAPTLLDYAGIAVPADMQGASMKELLAGRSVKNWRDKVYYHYYDKAYGVSAHYGIMTSRYKLIHFYDPVDTWELYDMEKDPSEMKNLYADPAYSKTIETLKKELSELRKKYRDDMPASGI
jgi:arylsulfatase A-like enzyme